MKRNLIIGERIMYVDKSTPLNCVFAVKIKGIIPPENLQAALGKIQQKHPLLRSKLREGQSGHPYFELCSDLDSIPVRITSRIDDEHWKAESAQEWGTLFDNEQQPMARVVWLKGAEYSDLLLVCPHCICDGTTFVALMSELLMLLDHPEKNLISYSPFQSIEVLLADSFSKTSLQVAKAKIFSGIARLYFFLKSTKHKPRSGSGYMLHWKMDIPSSTHLIRQSKAAGITLHAALCVAFLEAFKTVRKAQSHGKVICPVDVRRFVSEIKTDTMFAFAPIAELSINKDAGLDFVAKAKNLSQDLLDKISKMKIAEMLVMSEYFSGSVKKMVNHLKTTKGSHDLTLSNMGKLGIAEHYDSFELEAIHSPTVGFPWRNANTLVVSSFKGRMDFTFYSHDSFLSKSDAEQIKETAVKLLMNI